ncbi:hypothetical protein QZH41_019686, partial [Actinostola sp. cb2023]
HADDNFSGIVRDVPVPDCSSKEKKIASLPESYATVTPVVCCKNDPPLPKLDGSNKSDCQLITQAMQKEYRWLEEVREIMFHDTFEGDEALSWAAYHASCQPSDKDSRQSITSLLPLFYDEAKSVAMIRHSMDVVKKALEILNPGQVPVVTFDQPLYAIAKNIQWSWPESHGENQFVVMFGGLHIEMTALK